jgi:N6-L-threonylcarbamoyladenine synthase
MKVLGIETSCDDTAVAIVEDGVKVLASIVGTQTVHEAYGGVVPELASREHLQRIHEVYSECLAEAGAGLEELDGIAVTHGPGLIGSLLVGLSFAKGLAYASGLPFVGVNHLEAHLYSFAPAGLNCPYPFAGLIASGGHTEIVHVRDFEDYTVLGSTIDDAAGEAFDKIGVLLGLTYPAGPALDSLASEGDPDRFPLPAVRLKSAGPYDLSFSGLKTAARRLMESVSRSQGSAAVENVPLDVSGRDRADLAASFRQRVVGDIRDKLFAAARDAGLSRVALTGGVARNSLLRRSVRLEGEKMGMEVVIPDPRFCSDNAAMVAALGTFKLLRGARSSFALDAFPTMGDLA